MAIDNKEYTLKYVFITETGKNFTVSIRYANDTIPTDGQDKVNAFANLVLEKQPFIVTLESCEGAEFTITEKKDITVQATEAA